MAEAGGSRNRLSGGGTGRRWTCPKIGPLLLMDPVQAFFSWLQFSDYRAHIAQLVFVLAVGVAGTMVQGLGCRLRRCALESGEVETGPFYLNSGSKWPPQLNSAGKEFPHGKNAKT